MLAHILLDRLETLRLACESTILNFTQNTSVCQVQKAGQVTTDLKYQEGRLVVLSEIIRDLKRGDARDRAGIAALLEAAAERWGEQLARHLDSDHPAPLWVAYTQGAVDTAAEIADLLKALEAS